MQIAPPTCNSLWIVADLFTDVHLLTLEKQVVTSTCFYTLFLKSKVVKVHVMKKTLKWVKTWKQSPSAVIHIWQYGSALKEAMTRALSQVEAA